MKKSTSHQLLIKLSKTFSKSSKEKEIKPYEIVPLIPFQEDNWGKEGLEKILVSARRSLTIAEKTRLRSILQFRLPKELRKNYWLIASGARIEMQNNQSYYKNITENFPDCIISGYESQIKLDLKRTFPTETFFKNERTLIQMNNILQAYARRNTTIGYCQGFNFIVGRILEVTKNEEEAFWIFTQLIEGLLPVEYFTELVGIMTDCSILIQIVKEVLPEIYGHLHSLGFELSLNNLLYNWLVSIFVQNMKKDVWMPIWDLLFIDGNIMIFKAAIVILTLAKDLIMKQTNMIEINQFFEEDFKDFSDERLIDYLISKPFNYTMENINEFRKIQMPKVEQNIRQTSEYKRNRYKDQQVMCNLDWPICLNNLASINIEHVSVLKRLIVSKVSENFYSFDNDVYNIVKSNERLNESMKKNSKSQGDNSLKSKLDIFQNLLIERHQHFCKSTKSVIKEIELVRKSNSISHFFNKFGPSSKDALLFDDRRSLFCSSIIAEVEMSSLEEELSKENQDKDKKSDKMSQSDEIIIISSNQNHNGSNKESPKESELIQMAKDKTIEPFN